MNIQDLDLNLLLVFDAIYRERSISGAARKLNLSQPAVSNALRRLREYTGDTLFFRLGNEMKPTRTGNALAVPIGHALSTVAASFNTVRAFDPKTSTRTFRVAVNDAFLPALVPTLLSVAEREAPSIRLEFLPQSSRVDETVANLRDENIDLGMLPYPQSDPAISASPLHMEEFIFAVRSNHPALAKPMSKELLDGLRWVAFSNTPQLRAITENMFEQAGISRNVVTILPDTSIAPAIIEMTDLVAVMSKSIFDRRARDHAISMLTLPVKMPAVQVGLIWAKSADDDQGLIWLRTHIEQILRAATALTA